MQGIGEQAVNKMVEMAIANKLNDAEKLDVQVKTDPSKLSRGQVESVEILGEGVVLPEDLRLAEFQMQISEIAVKPLSAIFGKIELTQPSVGIVQLILTEADLNRALSAEVIDKELKARSHKTLQRVEQLEYRLQNDYIQINLVTDGQASSLILIPRLLRDKSIIVEESGNQNSHPGASTVKAILIYKLDKLLNLSALQAEGVSLSIKAFNILPEKLMLQANLKMMKIPVG